MEGEIVKRENITYQTIPAAGIHGVGLATLPGNISQLIRGFFASRKILAEFKPDVLFFTGGYLAVPMALAGIRWQSLLYVPDIEPGLALKTIARFSDQIAVTASESIQYFKNKLVTVTGYPTRKDLNRWDKQSGREFINIQSSKPVVLIFGGSKGARSINQAVCQHINEILAIAEVIHISGSLDWEMIQTARNALPATLQSEYHIFPYLHEMGAALASADLAISRSGASILGEYPHFQLPSILVPYPYAWRYQKVNADYLVNHGAALILENQQLADQLLPTLSNLLAKPEQLKQMGIAAGSLHTDNASQQIADILTRLAKPQEEK